MRFALFEYQKEGVKWLVSGKRRLLADGMGLGKSCQTLEAIRVLKDAQESALNVLIVCPAALVPMWVEMCRGWFDDCEVHELAKSKKIEFSNSIRIGVVSYNYLQKHVDRLVTVRWDVVVLDEAHSCVDKDTPVLTPDGYKPYHSLQVGDAVYSSSGNGLTVNRIQSKVGAWSAETLYYIFKLSNGRMLKCLGPHRIRLANGKWKQAKDIRESEELFGMSEESITQPETLLRPCVSIHAYKETNKITTPGKLNKKYVRGVWCGVYTEAAAYAILFQKVFCYLEEHTGFSKFWWKSLCGVCKKIRSSKQRKEESCGSQKDARTKPDVYGRGSTEDADDLKKNRSQTPYTGREWEEDSKSTVEDGHFDGSSVWGACNTGVSRWFKRVWQRLSNTLQSRLCYFRTEARGRGGRCITSVKNKKRTGQEKNRCINPIRVESIEIHQLGSAGEFNKSLTDFGDLSLESYPYNYIANGVVVHNCKNIKSKTCKAFRVLAEIHQGHLWMLTGTPATRSGQDYYIYLKVLMGLDMSYREFSDTYCIREWNPWRGGFDYKGVKDGKKAELRKLFSGITLRRRKEEVLKELPPKLISEVPCEVDAAIVAECAQVGEETVRQCLAEGVGIPAHIMKVIRSVGMGKVAAAVEIIENTDEPIVVMAIHKDVVSAICEKVGGVRVTGDETAEQKNQAVADFQSGKERVIVCNVSAGGVGITLTAATQMLFVELPWSPAVMRQAEDRIHRIGARGCSNIIRLIANNTVDKQILDVIAYKERFMTSVMGDMK